MSQATLDPTLAPTASEDQVARPAGTARTVALVLVVCAALAVAIGFRLWNLDRIGLNSDEAVYTGQAATLAGDSDLARYFSPFRAHPLFLQTFLALIFQVTGVGDVVARVSVALVFGVGSIVAAGFLARRMYDTTTAVLAVVTMAVLPYHVLLSRQVMLDIPLALASTLTMWAVYRYAQTGERRWWLLSAPLFGLGMLTKESGLLMALVIAVFLLWTGRLRDVRTRDAAMWVGLAALTVAPFIVTRLLFGGSTTGGYLLYQALRDPNHEWWYFPVVLWEFVTPLLTLFIAGGLVLMAVRRSLADKALLSWVLVMGGFFQVWPTKLFPYIVAIAPALVIAAAQAISWLGRKLWPARSAVVTSLIGLAILAPLVPGSARVINLGTENIQGPFKADVEVQDFAGSREAARWIGAHTPDESVFLTIGPSVGNIVSFYGHRDWYALSVSPDPSKRNPAYRPIPNPDLAIRRFHIHYAVWDFYSADRSVFYSSRLMKYVRKYEGRPVYSVWVENGTVHSGRVAPEGSDERLVIYDLVGGNPLPRSGSES